jgi:hypothetical protein
MERLKFSLCVRGGLILLVSLSTMAMDSQYKGQLSHEVDQSQNIHKTLYDYLNLFVEKSYDAVRELRNNTYTIRRYCLVNTDVTTLLLMGLFLAVSGQNGTELSECVKVLNQCMHNNTALLNQILENTSPTPGVDVYSGYWWTIFGAAVSTVGLFITGFCDFGAGYFYETRAEERVHGFINELKDEKETIEKYRKNEEWFKEVSLSLSEEISDMDEDQIKELIEKALNNEISPRDFMNIILNNSAPDYIVTMKYDSVK